MSRRKYPTCDRCGRRGRSKQAIADWNVSFNRGVITELICDRCQTPEENAEAAVNDAMLEYALIDGRHAARPKVSPE